MNSLMLKIDTKLRKILDEMFDSNIDYSVGYNSIKREEYIVLLNQAINQFNTQSLKGPGT